MVRSARLERAAFRVGVVSIPNSQFFIMCCIISINPVFWRVACRSFLHLHHNLLTLSVDTLSYVASSMDSMRSIADFSFSLSTPT